MSHPRGQFMPSAFSTSTSSFALSDIQLSSDSQLRRAASNTSSSNPLSSLHDPSQSSLGSTPYRKHSQQLSALDFDTPPSSYIQDQQRSTGSSQEGFSLSLIPYTDIQHSPQVPPYEPWTGYSASIPSMRIEPLRNLPGLKQTTKRPPTDSGYGSELLSSQALSTSSIANRSRTDRPTDLYDAPIGSTAEQNQILPDQRRQRRKPSSVIQSSPSTASNLATETPPTASTNQTFRCNDCNDIFSTKSEMTKHDARHKKKFTCNHRGCPRGKEGHGFATKNDLDRHKANVHDDVTVLRKTYKCCVPGCKDPIKFWNRKDNFKAHVKRMHPNENPDTIVERSLHDDNTPQMNESTYVSGPSREAPGAHTNADDMSALYGTGTGPGPSRMSSYPLMHLGSQLPQTTIATSPYGQNMDDPFAAHSVFDQQADQDRTPWDAEGDLYDAPQVRSSSGQRLEFPATTQGNASNYQHPGASEMGASTTLMAPTSHQEVSAPTITPRQIGGSFPPRLTTSRMQYIPPIDAQTAPITFNHSKDEIFQGNLQGWGIQNFEASPISDPPMGKIDPSLQTGSWQHLSTFNSYPPQAEISEPSVQPAQPSIDTPPNHNQPMNQRGADLRRTVQALLEKLSDSELETTMEAYKRHPQVPNKESCIVKSAIDTVLSRQSEKPFPCTRPGCTKTFAKRNVCTKHEKRHDRSFFCTFDGCDKRFGSKHDLRRHERQIHKSESFFGWRCFVDDVPTSQHKIDCFKFFNEEEDFKRHRKIEHRERAAANGEGLRALKKCLVRQGHPGPFWCGFCKKVIPNEPSGVDGTECDKIRYDHIDNHITKDKKRMEDWIDLKSDGLSKTQVIEQSRSQSDSRVAHDESDEEGDDVFDEEAEEDDDDDDGSPTPDMSATLTGSIPQGPVYSGQHLGVPFPVSQGRKRAHSNTGIPSQVGSHKFPRTMNYQAPREAMSMSRGVSDIANIGSTNFAFNSGTASSGYLEILCCQCHKRRPVNGGLTCDDLSCLHSPCRDCEFFNSQGRRVYFRARPGPGSGLGG